MSRAFDEGENINVSIGGAKTILETALVGSPTPLVGNNRLSPDVLVENVRPSHAGTCACSTYDDHPTFCPPTAVIFRLGAAEAELSVGSTSAMHADFAGWTTRGWTSRSARGAGQVPALSLIGGAGQAVGVAIGAGFFAFFYFFLYATLPVEGGERIVALENWDTDANTEMRRSMHDLVMWQREMKTVEEIGAFRTIARNLTSAGGAAEAVQVAQITAVGFNITRVTPVIGRAMVAADESAAALPIVIIGYDVWHSRFGGDASVLGRELRLGNAMHTIVGVMPEGYGFPVNHSYWIPLSSNATLGPREGPEVFIFGRLRDGVAMAQAQAELSALGAQAASAFPLTRPAATARDAVRAPDSRHRRDQHPRLHGDAVTDQYAGADSRY